MKSFTEAYTNADLPPNSSFRIIEGEEGVQGTPEWLAFKEGKLGASQAPSIAGKNPYTTPLMEFEAIVNRTEKKVNAYMQRGKDEEPKALAWFNNFIGSPLMPTVIQSIDYPFLMASLDGFFIEDEKPCGCEIKTVSLDDYLIAKEGLIPEKHLWQIYHQMLLTGAERWYYVAWVGNDEGTVIPVYKDREKELELLAKLLEFQRMLLTFDPPEATEKDWLPLNDEEIEKLAFEHENFKCIEANAKKRKEELKNEIISRVSKFHSRVKIGACFKAQKIVKKGTINYEAIPELRGVNLEAHRKAPVVSWRID